MPRAATGQRPLNALSEGSTSFSWAAESASGCTPTVRLQKVFNVLRAAGVRTP
jgi:hypothetical protein